MSIGSTLKRDLLEQADHLSRLEPRRPKQASLRRAVSSAYYAVFHLLIGQAAGLLLPGRLSIFRPFLARAFNHGEMKRAAQSFVGGTLPDVVSRTLGDRAPAIEKEVAEVAATFLALQSARNDADYDLGRRFARREVQDLVDRARDAFTAWSRIGRRDSAQLFLLSLLVTDRVRGR